MGECRKQKHTQHAPSTKTEYDYLNGRIRKWSHTEEKISPKVVNPRDTAGNAEENEEEEEEEERKKERKKEEEEEEEEEDS